YHTDAGRVVRGGGGIRPDVIVHADSTTADDRRFLKALGDHFGAFRDAVTAYALSLRDGAPPRLSPDFSVTPAMRLAVRERLRQKGVTMSDADWTAGRSLVDLWVTADVARYLFGRETELRRRAAADPQMQAALRLLGGAADPKALFAAAAAGR
ncbi:MAG TPA: hypothetical protein VFS28_01760, partial [Gemmatimonadales bacterium]|nr:hypothetical protein [Gemmatimonadales bacterium]